MHTFGRLLGFLRPYKRGVVWSLVLAALAMVCTVAIPWLTGPRGRPDLRRRSRRPAHAGAGRGRRRAAAAGAVGLPAARRGPRVAGDRVRPAHAAVRAPAEARARVLRRPADRPADVARDRRPVLGALLPRLRARLHPAIRVDDPARRDRDVLALPRAGGAGADPGAVRGRRRHALRAPLAAGAAGGPAADRRGHRGRRGEHLRRARGEGLRGRAAPARALPRQRRPGLRPVDGRDPPCAPSTTRSWPSCRTSGWP